MRSLVRPLGVAAGILLATSCAAPPVARPPIPLDPEGVRAELLRDESAVRSVKGLARVEFAGPRGSGSVSQVIVVALPDRARVETLSPLGTTALVVVLRGEEIRLHSPVSREYGVGRASGALVGRLLDVPVPPALLVRLLAGLPPLALHAGDPRFDAVADGPGVRVESVDGPWWQRLWAGEGMGIDRGEVGRSAETILRFGFSDRRSAGGVQFPFSIWVEDAAQGGRLQVTYERLQLNPTVDDALFDLPPPRDSETRFIDLGRGFPPPAAP